jgi:hypothetical protein
MCSSVLTAAAQVRILAWWARVGGGLGGPALATSDSNIAVDNLLEGLIRAGVRAVRLGRPDRIRPELLQYCVDVPAPGRTEVNWAEKISTIKNAQVRGGDAPTPPAACTRARTRLFPFLPPLSPCLRPLPVAFCPSGVGPLPARQGRG